jgi:hypothetical protein
MLRVSQALQYFGKKDLRLGFQMTEKLEPLCTFVEVSGRFGAVHESFTVCRVIVRHHSCRMTVLRMKKQVYAQNLVRQAVRSVPMKKMSCPRG